jgi:hypothetical protein
MFANSSVHLVTGLRFGLWGVFSFPACRYPFWGSRSPLSSGYFELFARADLLSCRNSLPKVEDMELVDIYLHSKCHRGNLLNKLQGYWLCVLPWYFLAKKNCTLGFLLRVIY